jgi:hypothetical protein
MVRRGDDGLIALFAAAGERAVCARHDATILGPESGSAFHRLIQGGETPDFQTFVRELVELSLGPVEFDPKVGGILMESASMPPVVASVRAATGLPVRHILDLVTETPDRFRGPALEQPGARLVQ